jgi:hypothetical protein
MQEQNGKEDAASPAAQTMNNSNVPANNDGNEYCMPETCSSFGVFQEKGTWEAFDARPLLPKGE